MRNFKHAVFVASRAAMPGTLKTLSYSESMKKTQSHGLIKKENTIKVLSEGPILTSTRNTLEDSALSLQPGITCLNHQVGQEHCQIVIQN